MLSHSLELFLKHCSRFLVKFGFYKSTELNVSLELIGDKVWMKGVFFKSMHIYDMLGNHVILIISLFIIDYKE